MSLKKYSRKNLIYLSVLVIIFSCVFTYIFDPSLNLGGDNSEYYMMATSIAQGDGYVNLGNIDHKPTNAFPPGYPLLMAPLRVFTDSIVAQKILNGIFLLAGLMVFFLFIRKYGKPASLAFTAVVVALLNYRVLEFGTIMMSEMSFIMFSALIVYLLYLFDKREDVTDNVWWKNPYLYLLIICAGYAFQIRTQGVSIIVAVAIWMLTVRKWKQALVFAGGFWITTLPWTIRNHIVGLGGSRYLNEIMAVNIWRPEEGYITFGALIERGWGTLKMLVTKAIPNTVTPYFDVDYNVPATFSEWITGLLLIGLISYGFWQYRRCFWFFMSYSAAVIGVICLWSAPSENRYIVTLVPVLEIGLVTGVFALLNWLLNKAGVKKTFSALWLLIPAVLFAATPLSKLSESSKQGQPPAYVNYFKVAEYVKDNLPAESVVCSRKPSLFYVYSQGFVCNYRYSQDEGELIRNLISNKVDYVVLEQLGYASTGRYLYPVLVNNQDLFRIIYHLPNPDTYLLQFDRQAAIKKFGQDDK